MPVTVDEELDQEDRVVDPARVEEVDRGSRPGRDRQEEGGQEDHGPEGAPHRGAVCHRARERRRGAGEAEAERRGRGWRGPGLAACVLGFRAVVRRV